MTGDYHRLNMPLSGQLYKEVAGSRHLRMSWLLSVGLRKELAGHQDGRPHTWGAGLLHTGLQSDSILSMSSLDKDAFLYYRFPDLINANGNYTSLIFYVYK